VTIEVDQPHYSSGQAITVTIHNDRAAPIYAFDNHADCTVVSLEHLASGVWEGVASCVNEQPSPNIVTVEAGATRTEVVPGVNDYSGYPWPGGVYRAAVAYTTSLDQAFGQSSLAYSASFAIG
jgi:hypothetical protein